MQYITPSHAFRIGFLIFFWNKLKKYIYYNLVQTRLSPINWQDKLHKCSNLKFWKFEICKTFLNNEISTFYFWTFFLTLFLHLWNLIDIICVLLYWRHIPARLLYSDFGCYLSIPHFFLFPFEKTSKGKFKPSCFIPFIFNKGKKIMNSL